MQDDEEEMGGAEGYFGGEAPCRSPGKASRQSSFKAGGGAGSNKFAGGSVLAAAAAAAAQPWSARQQWKKSYRIVRVANALAAAPSSSSATAASSSSPSTVAEEEEGEGAPIIVPFRDRSERTKALVEMLRERSFKSSGQDRTNKKNLTGDEEREVGTVALSVWKRFAAFLGPCSVFIVLLSMVAAQAASFVESLWLAKWAQADPGTSVWMYAGVYAGITVLICLFNAIRTVGLFWVFLVASRKIHSQTLNGVLLPMAFFDTTPLGRVLNRFSKELQQVDVNIGMPMSNVLKFGLRLIFSIILIVYGTSAYLLLIFIPLSLGWYLLQKHYRNSARELQRLNSISKSPIYSAFNEALNGCATIQAFGDCERFALLQQERFDYNLRAGLVMEAVGIWLQVWLQCLSSIVIGGAAVFCVISGEEAAQSRGSSSATARAALAGLDHLRASTDG